MLASTALVPGKGAVGRGPHAFSSRFIKAAQSCAIALLAKGQVTATIKSLNTWTENNIDEAAELKICAKMLVLMQREWDGRKRHVENAMEIPTKFEQSCNVENCTMC